MELINLSHMDAGKWQVATLKAMANLSGFTFVTFESKIDDIQDVVTRIYSEGELIFHASDYMMGISPKGDPFISPQGMAMFIPKGNSSTEEERAYIDNQVGGWDALEYWLDNAISPTIAFQGKSVGDLLRGCKKAQQTLGRGTWVDFFKEYQDHWYAAMKGEILHP